MCLSLLYFVFLYLYCYTGKTTIANYLSGQQDNLINNKVEPTSGVRILEFDLQTKDQDIQDVINIEMWDASGDYK